MKRTYQVTVHRVYVMRYTVDADNTSAAVDTALSLANLCLDEEAGKPHHEISNVMETRVRDSAFDA